jgi:hypothetical protein
MLKYASRKVHSGHFFAENWKNGINWKCFAIAFGLTVTARMILPPEAALWALMGVFLATAVVLDLAGRVSKKAGHSSPH